MDLVILFWVVDLVVVLSYFELFGLVVVEV